MCAESIKMIVVRPLLIDVLDALESRYVAGYPESESPFWSPDFDQDIMLEPARIV
jgi:hypothetical protein